MIQLSNLDDWQIEALKYEGDLLLATGRQVGKTSIMSVKCAEYIISHPKSTIIIASLTEDQAKLIIIMILDYLQKNYKTEIAKGKNKPTLNKITLKNQSSCLARPVGNTGDALRGFTGDILVLDEVARFSELIMISATPTLASTGGELWLCSTFFGTGNYFHKCFINKDNRFKVITASTEDVYRNRKISDSWTVERRDKALKFLEEEKKEKTTLQYAQEYLGIPMSDLRQVFDDELIQKSMKAKRPDRILHSNNYYLGVDIARMGDDETTFEIIDRTNKEILMHVENQITKRTLLTQTFDRIIELNRIYNFKQIFIDDGGMGVGVFDMLLRHDETKRKVIAINNSTRPLDKDDLRKKRTLKEDIYNNLLMLMQRDQIQLLEDPEIFQSLKSVQFEIDEKSKKRKYHGNYTHIADGLVRAAWCNSDKRLNTYMA